MNIQQNQNYISQNNNYNFQYIEDNQKKKQSLTQNSFYPKNSNHNKIHSPEENCLKRVTNDAVTKINSTREQPLVLFQKNLKQFPNSFKKNLTKSPMGKNQYISDGGLQKKAEKFTKPYTSNSNKNNNVNNANNNNINIADNGNNNNGKSSQGHLKNNFINGNNNINNNMALNSGNKIKTTGLNGDNNVNNINYNNNMNINTNNKRVTNIKVKNGKNSLTEAKKYYTEENNKVFYKTVRDSVKRPLFNKDKNKHQQQNQNQNQNLNQNQNQNKKESPNKKKLYNKNNNEYQDKNELMNKLVKNAFTNSVADVKQEERFRKPTLKEMLTKRKKEILKINKVENEEIDKITIEDINNNNNNKTNNNWNCNLTEGNNNIIINTTNSNYTNSNINNTTHSKERIRKIKNQKKQNNQNNKENFNNKQNNNNDLNNEYFNKDINENDNEKINSKTDQNFYNYKKIKKINKPSVNQFEFIQKIQEEKKNLNRNSNTYNYNINNNGEKHCLSTNPGIKKERNVDNGSREPRLNNFITSNNNNNNKEQNLNDSFRHKNAINGNSLKSKTIPKNNKSFKENKEPNISKNMNFNINITNNSGSNFYVKKNNYLSEKDKDKKTLNYNNNNNNNNNYNNKRLNDSESRASKDLHDEYPYSHRKSYRPPEELNNFIKDQKEKEKKLKQENELEKQKKNLARFQNLCILNQKEYNQERNYLSKSNANLNTNLNPNQNQNQNAISNLLSKTNSFENTTYTKFPKNSKSFNRGSMNGIGTNTDNYIKKKKEINNYYVGNDSFKNNNSTFIDPDEYYLNVLVSQQLINNPNANNRNENNIGNENNNLGSTNSNFKSNGCSKNNFNTCNVNSNNNLGNRINSNNCTIKNNNNYNTTNNEVQGNQNQIKKIKLENRNKDKNKDKNRDKDKEKEKDNKEKERERGREKPKQKNNKDQIINNIINHSNPLNNNNNTNSNNINNIIIDNNNSNYINNNNNNNTNKKIQNLNPLIQKGALNFITTVKLIIKKKLFLYLYEPYINTIVSQQYFIGFAFLVSIFKQYPFHKLQEYYQKTKEKPNINHFTNILSNAINDAQKDTNNNNNNNKENNNINKPNKNKGYDNNMRKKLGLFIEVITAVFKIKIMEKILSFCHVKEVEFIEKKIERMIKLIIKTPLINSFKYFIRKLKNKNKKDIQNQNKNSNQNQKEPVIEKNEVKRKNKERNENQIKNQNERKDNNQRIIDDNDNNNSSNSSIHRMKDTSVKMNSYLYESFDSEDNISVEPNSVDNDKLHQFRMMLLLKKNMLMENGVEDDEFDEIEEGENEDEESIPHHQRPKIEDKKENRENKEKVEKNKNKNKNKNNENENKKEKENNEPKKNIVENNNKKDDDDNKNEKSNEYINENINNSDITAEKDNNVSIDWEYNLSTSALRDSLTKEKEKSSNNEKDKDKDKKKEEKLLDSDSDEKYDGEFDVSIPEEVINEEKEKEEDQKEEPKKQNPKNKTQPSINFNKELNKKENTNLRYDDNATNKKLNNDNNQNQNQNQKKENEKEDEKKKILPEEEEKNQKENEKEKEKEKEKEEAPVNLEKLKEIKNPKKFADELAEEILSKILKNEISSKNVKLIPKKLFKYESALAALGDSQSNISANSCNNLRDNLSKEFGLLSLSKLSLQDENLLNDSIMSSYSEYSVFNKTIKDKKKEHSLNLYFKKIAPKLVRLIRAEIYEKYPLIYKNISTPLQNNSKGLMISLVLQDPVMFGNNHKVVPRSIGGEGGDENNENMEGEGDLKQIIDKEKILKNFESLNRKIRAEDNVSSDNFYDNILNECLIDTAVEIIENERKYGENGTPLLWSSRTHELVFKYSKDNPKKLADHVTKNLLKILHNRIGLIVENYDYLNVDQINAERDKRLLKAIQNELTENDYKWKNLEVEETQMKVEATETIMEHLINETIQILEHIQNSRRRPDLYQYKSIYGCEDIPPLSFQQQQTSGTNDRQTNDDDNEDQVLSF